MHGCGSACLVHLHRPWFTGVTAVWCERLLVVPYVCRFFSLQVASVNHMRRGRKLLLLLATNAVAISQLPLDFSYVHRMIKVLYYGIKKAKTT